MDVGANRIWRNLRLGIRRALTAIPVAALLVVAIACAPEEDLNEFTDQPPAGEATAPQAGGTPAVPGEDEPTDAAPDAIPEEPEAEAENGWIDVAPCDAENFACGEPAKVEIADPALTIEVSSNGYVPESDIIIGTFNFFPDESLDPMLYRLSADGEVLQAWRITNKHGSILGDRRMLPNGNILFTVFKDGVYEMDAEGNIVWHYLDDGISHHAEMLPNGNILAAGIYCDCVREIDYESAEPVWEWYVRDGFQDYDDEAVFPGGEQFRHKSPFATFSRVDTIKPDSWAHLNHAQMLPNDNVLVSIRNFDLVAEVDRDGRIVWSYGPGIIKHQHTPRVLDDGTMTVFDNGNVRAMVVDRGTQEVLWEHADMENTAVMGEVNRLADGNYKVVSSLENVVKVVSPEGEVLWSMTITTDEDSGGIYRAHLPQLED